jgi:hypothetical protein
MKHEDKEIRTISEFLIRLDTHKSPDDLVWFRGQTNTNWPVVPSIFRKGSNPIDRENSYYRKFKQNAGRYVEAKTSTDWDWFLLMQHYDTPTRLLDWTESPLVGLYFAVEDDKENPENNSKDGVLYSLLPEELNRKFNRILVVKNDLPLIDSDKFLDEYLFFGKSPENFPSKPVAAIAQRNSPRIFAQQGVFVIYSNSDEPLERIADDCMWRYIIPSANKDSLRRELDLLGINRVSLFPELANLGKHIKESI